jgi:uncharacterized protein YggE
MKYIIIGFLIVGLIALTGCQQTQENTINVAGNSEISVEPDEAEVWAGISIVKDTATEAQNEANKVINAIVNGLKEKGYEDIETERLNLYEERTWTEDEGSKVIGWRASQTLKIKTEELDDVGEIVDICVDNGANQINNIQFQLSNEEEQKYKKQALAEATQSAKEKAETIADSLGVSLGKIKTVSESSFRYTPYVYAMEKVAGADAVEEAAIVMPKDVTVTADIQLVYYVR